MPVEFLSDQQAAAYGRFVEDPSQAELERYFFLDDFDRGLIETRRRAHNRLGFALQLGTVRFIGRFLEDPLDVPWSVVDYLAVQLGVDDASVVKRYAERQSTQWEHAGEIQAAFGFRDFSDEAAQAGLVEFLDGRAWTHAEGPYSLFNQAVAWLRRERVLLPGVSILARQVAGARTGATERMYRTLDEAAASADAELPARLRGLLAVPEGQRASGLELLRQPPRKASGKAMNAALVRVSNALAVGARSAHVQGVPANRVAALAKYGLAAKAPAITDLTEPRHTATLLATVRHLEAAAVDDALDLFDTLMAHRLINAARRASAAERLASLPKLEKASRLLARATEAVIAVLEAADANEAAVLDVAWSAIEEAVPRAAVTAARAVVDELVPDDDAADAVTRQILAGRYGVVRPFLELLAQAMPLQATPAGTDVLHEVRRLPDLARRRVNLKPLPAGDVNADLVGTQGWRRAVFAHPDLPPGAADRDAYVMCVLTRLHACLRRRDVFAEPSLRWSDPRAKLLEGAEWLAVRGDVLAGLGLDEPVEQHLDGLSAALGAAWRLLAQRMEEAGPDASVRLAPAGPDGRVRLEVSRLEAIGESPSLKGLRTTVAGMLPRVDLPDLLLEVHAWTKFLRAYTHVGEMASRVDDVEISICALLIAEACNVGLGPIASAGIEALTRGRLSHVDQNYLRADTHSAANAALIDAQAAIPTAQMWGGGLLASVDGMRFVVPVASINTAPSPRYFGLKRGITWLNAINDQVAGIGAVVVPGTMRDSLNILDALLNLDAGPKPEMIATDTAAYSDIVFGLFRLLGYRFSPRIADMGSQTFWRTTPASRPEGDYGPLNAIAKGTVNLGKIKAHWPDMLRVAGSLVTNQVRAYDLLRMLGRDGHASALGQAFAEYGRIAKTLHMLAFIDPIDTGYRRVVTRQLNIGESRHSLARKVFHGQRGEMRQAYREGQEDQLGALGLVLNAIVLWNTRYIDAAVAKLRADGHQIDDADVARLSPLGHAHINVHGRYAFTPRTGTALRPLRDPNISDDV